MKQRKHAVKDFPVQGRHFKMDDIYKLIYSLSQGLAMTKASSAIRQYRPYLICENALVCGSAK